MPPPMPPPIPGGIMGGGIFLEEDFGGDFADDFGGAFFAFAGSAFFMGAILFSFALVSCAD